MKLHEKLLQLRKKTFVNNKPLTQEELAFELAISQAQISRYETGIEIPPSSMLKKIAIYFKIGVAELTDGETIKYCFPTNGTEEQMVMFRASKRLLEATNQDEIKRIYVEEFPKIEYVYKYNEARKQYWGKK